MATVIDSLVLELGLDPSKFTQGQKEAVESLRQSEQAASRFGKGVEREGQRIEDVFSNLKKEALGLVAVFLGGKGIKDFVGYVTSLDAATGRAAYTLNMSARELSIWEGAAAQVGAQTGSVTSAMQGLSSSMNQFMLTGQGPFLAVMTHLGLSMFDQNNRLKTASQMFLEIADAVHKLNQSDPARAAATLSLIPGANQDSINLMIKGRAALESLLDASRKTGGATQDSVEKFAEYQKQMALLERASTSLGRSLVIVLAPALTAVANALSNLLSIWNTSADSPAGKAIVAQNRQDSRKRADPAKFMNWVGENIFPLLGMKYTDADRAEVNRMYEDDKIADGRAIANAQQSDARSPDWSGGPGRGTLAEQEAYIRKAAAARGINPDVAVKVWESEGKYGVGPSLQSNVITRDGTREESYGPYQLYMRGGLGNKFMEQTGKDPRDPDTWKAQVDWSLDQAVKGGWGPWHGWRGLPRAGLPAPGGASGAAMNSGGRQSALPPAGNQTNTVTIGEVKIQTQATDAEGIANSIPAALQRANWAASANFGQTG